MICNIWLTLGLTIFTASQYLLDDQSEDLSFDSDVIEDAAASRSKEDKKTKTFNTRSREQILHDERGSSLRGSTVEKKFDINNSLASSFRPGKLTPIQILSRLFHSESTTVLELVLQGCEGDLIKAIEHFLSVSEKDTPTNSGRQSRDETGITDSLRCVDSSRTSSISPYIPLPHCPCTRKRRSSEADSHKTSLLYSFESLSKSDQEKVPAAGQRQSWIDLEERSSSFSKLRKGFEDSLKRLDPSITVFPGEQLLPQENKSEIPPTLYRPYLHGNPPNDASSELTTSKLRNVMLSMNGRRHEVPQTNMAITHLRYQSAFPYLRGQVPQEFSFGFSNFITNKPAYNRLHFPLRSFY